LQFWISDIRRVVAAILKIQRITQSPQRSYRFWQNLAQWCNCDLWASPANKIFQIHKSKIAAVAILKKQKIAVSQRRIDQFLHNLTRWCISALQILLVNKILQFLTLKMVASAIEKNCNISTMDGPIETKFGMVMCLDPPDLISK